MESAERPDDRPENTGDGKPPERELTFKRSVLIIAVMIISYQLVTFALAVSFGFSVFPESNDQMPELYYLINHVLGIVWFFAFLYVVMADIDAHGLNPHLLFNWNTDILFKYLPRVLLYFFGCGIFVVLFSMLTTETELELAGGNPAIVLLSFLGAVVIAPIVEELIFRGYLQTAMLKEFKRSRERIVVNGMLFAMAHIFILTAIVASFPYYIFVLGFLFAKLYEETRSVLPGIMLHALNNLLVFSIDIAKLTYFQETVSALF